MPSREPPLAVFALVHAPHYGARSATGAAYRRVWGHQRPRPYLVYSGAKRPRTDAVGPPMENLRANRVLCRAGRHRTLRALENSLSVRPVVVDVSPGRATQHLRSRECGVRLPTACCTTPAPQAMVKGCQSGVVVVKRKATFTCENTVLCCSANWAVLCSQRRSRRFESAHLHQRSPGHGRYPSSGRWTRIGFETSGVAARGTLG